MTKRIRLFFMLCISLIALLAVPAWAKATTYKGYTIDSSNTRVYKDTAFTKGYGWIFGSDEVTFLTMQPSFCRVRYPISGGRTKTGYVHTSALLLSYKGKQYTAREQVKTYRRPGGASYGYISPKDVVEVLGSTQNGYTQVKYPVPGGYKFAFIYTSDFERYIKPEPIKPEFTPTPTPVPDTQGGTHELSNGWYMIISGNSADRVLDINNWNQDNGGNLETYYKNNTTNQRFALRYQGNGYYTIQCLHSGRYLHIQDENDDKSNVHQWEGNTYKNSQWALIPAGNSYYYLKNKGNGSYLDNSGGSTNPGNNVQTYPFNRSPAQKWRFVSTSDGSDERQTLKDGWYTVQSANNTSYVWDINMGTNEGKDNGANLEIYPSHGGNNQKFYLRYSSKGYYYIQIGHTLKYLHKQDAGHTENVLQWENYSETAIQTHWVIAPAGNGFYYVRAMAGNYVDNVDGRVQNANNVRTYYFNGSNAQKWRFVPTSAPTSSPAPQDTSETYYVTTRAGLAFRKGPGTGYQKILSLGYGAAVEVFAIENGWARGRYKGNDGYCSAKYLSKTNPQGQEPQGNYSFAPYTGLNYESLLESYKSSGRISSQEYSNRLAVLSQAQRMCTILWTSPVSFHSWKGSGLGYNSNQAMRYQGSFTSKHLFDKGCTYVGLPYAANAGYNTYTVEKWMSLIGSDKNLSTYEGTVNFLNVTRRQCTFRGVDCSGFVYNAYRSIPSYNLGYLATGDLMDSSSWKKIGKSSALPGDILLKNGHVMIYVGKTSSGQYAVMESVADGENGCSGCRYYPHNSISGYGFYRYSKIANG